MQTSSKTYFYKSWIFWAVIYGLLILIYNLAFIFIDPSKKVLLTSNELGDFLAGIFAPLAFLFLYLGYKQQGWELKQNTLALNLQAQELKNSVEQQKALAEATIDDLNITKEQIQTQRRKELIEAQPFWHFDLRSIYKDKPENIMGSIQVIPDSSFTSINVDARLANSRAVAREVKLTVLKDKNIVKQFNFPLFEKSPDLHNISIRLSYPHCFNENGELKLMYRIVYLDALDNPQYQEFEILAMRKMEVSTQYSKVERIGRSY